ncbi:MAG: hypothetical protein MUC65_01160 [Pontiellaceae bacterium]|jgi:hypothetical protein|nr:hypothetical protein [Pontiellaceae bacterium]
MRKLLTCLLGIALAAGFASGAEFKFTNGAGDGLWETIRTGEDPSFLYNWLMDGISSEVLPGEQDNVFKSNPSVTCTVSSSNTINILRINEGGPGMVTLHMQDAWLTLRSNQWASIAYNVASGPSTLTMTNSTIIHLALAETSSSPNLNGHFNVGYKAPTTAYLSTSTLIMDNSKILLPRGTFRMIPGGPQDTLVDEIYFDSELNELHNTNTITMNNNSVIETVSFRNMDNGLIYINSGSYIRGVENTSVINNSPFDADSLMQLEQLINNGWIIVNGTPVTQSNRDQFIYTNDVARTISIGDGVIPTLSPYETIWTNEVVYGDAGTALTNDFDEDGMINLYEYALNGEMQNAANTGTDPVFARSADNSFEYTVVKRTNDASLVYDIQARTDLLSGDWTNIVCNVLDTTPLVENFVEVKYSVPSTNITFLRLKITMPTP